MLWYVGIWGTLWNKNKFRFSDETLPGKGDFLTFPTSHFTYSNCCFLLQSEQLSSSSLLSLAVSHSPVRSLSNTEVAHIWGVTHTRRVRLHLCLWVGGLLEASGILYLLGLLRAMYHESWPVHSKLGLQNPSVAMMFCYVIIGLLCLKCVFNFFLM